MTRVAWDWGDRIDAATLSKTGEGWTIAGATASTRYRVEIDAAWFARSVEVETPAGRLTLAREPAGWARDGAVLPGTDGCIDVDIACTAATNTLPIRRLHLPTGSAAELDVLYIPAPDLTPCVDRQRYTLTASGWTYEGLSSGFRAALTVDGEGIVIDYPGLCRRIGASG